MNLNWINWSRITRPIAGLWGSMVLVLSLSECNRWMESAMLNDGVFVVLPFFIQIQSFPKKHRFSVLMMTIHAWISFEIPFSILSVAMSCNSNASWRTIANRSELNTAENYKMPIKEKRWSLPFIDKIRNSVNLKTIQMEFLNQSLHTISHLNDLTNIPNTLAIGAKTMRCIFIRWNRHQINMYLYCWKPLFRLFFDGICREKYLSWLPLNKNLPFTAFTNRLFCWFFVWLINKFFAWRLSFNSGTAGWYCVNKQFCFWRWVVSTIPFVLFKSMSWPVKPFLQNSVVCVCKMAEGQQYYFELDCNHLRVIITLAQRSRSLSKPKSALNCCFQSISS